MRSYWPLLVLVGGSLIGTTIWYLAIEYAKNSDSDKSSAGGYIFTQMFVTPIIFVVCWYVSLVACVILQSFRVCP